MVKSYVVTPSIQLLALDIDGTLLNPQFQISAADMSALRRANALGIEVVLVTGRRHDFALPIAQQLGFDLWIISSNGAVTRSLTGETFYRDLLPALTCRRLSQAMIEFRGHTVLTFDRRGKGAIVLEHLNNLESSIRRWLEKNMEYIEFVIPLEDALITDPIQAMFCGPIGKMYQALSALEGCPVAREIKVLRTEYPERDLSIVDVLNTGCSKGHALERWADFRAISRGRVMAIGDNYNDIEMLAFAGYPVIMGNASEELRGRGWKVTSSNAQNGVAVALEPMLDG
jgi:Cof subfamily protein (haloacid dehalogenase superfamily)